ncbi:tRNA (adenine-N1)-methyltransferase [Desulfurococcaceae archaeon MEX13E-LK6-19]|nr:tRNA (adenine-N1)-methyltransferase [Desulfurococcaceae archaeon MEX13E-LK6-19]
MSKDNIITEGSIVYIIIDSKRRFLVEVKKGGILGTDKGFIKHDEIIGKEFGSTIKTSLGYQAYLMRPLPQDYLNGFKRVTQVIYPKDASLMVYLSGIGPGSHVVEAGVGTGFLTSYLARIVGENGRVYGYEIRKDFLEVARENLSKAKLIDRVILKNKDIREGIDEKNVDAVFLDIPDPWNALEYVHNALKPSCPVLIYVPTINQVDKVLDAIKKHDGFIDVNVYESLLRTYMTTPGALRPHTLMIGHTGYIVFARKRLL